MTPTTSNVARKKAEPEAKEVRLPFIPKSFHEFLSLHNSRKKKDKQRMGQRFCYMYLTQKWPELYYAPFPTAKFLICTWLIANQFTTHLPEVTDIENKIVSLRARFGKTSR